MGGCATKPKEPLGEKPETLPADSTAINSPPEEKAGPEVTAEAEEPKMEAPVAVVAAGEEEPKFDAEPDEVLTTIAAPETLLTLEEKQEEAAAEPTLADEIAEKAAEVVSSVEESAKESADEVEGGEKKEEAEVATATTSAPA